MQLVLGIQSGLDLGMSSSPLPLQPEGEAPFARSRRVLRRAAWCGAFLVLVALGVLQGARVAIGAAGVSELAEGASTPSQLAAPEAKAQEARTATGEFWRPNDSTAERPRPELTPRRWAPTPRK